MKNSYLFFLLILLFCSKFYGQEYAISYMYDAENKVTKNSVIHENFNPFKKEINKGFNNGVYWFKIQLDVKQPYVLQIENSRILHANLYVNNRELKKMQTVNNITFKLPKEIKGDFFLKVIVEKEAFIPIRIQTFKEFEEDTSLSLFINGAYYGFAIMMLAINLFYFMNFREKKFIKYIFFNMFITLSIFYSEGLFNFFGFNNFINSNIEAVLHVAVAIFGFIFMTSYLKVKQQFFVKILYVISFLLLTSLVLYIITKKFLFFISIEYLCLTSLILNFVYSFKNFRNNRETKFFTIAYTVIIIASINFYLFRIIGVPMLNNSIYLLKIGGIIEMLLFTYALVYSMRKIVEENAAMHKTIVSYSYEIEELSQTKKEKTNEKRFNQREKEILLLLKQNKTNLEISEELHISINTVKYHLKNIYKKLNVKTRKEITKYPF